MARARRAGALKGGLPFSQSESLCKVLLKPCTRSVHNTSTPAVNTRGIFPKYLLKVSVLRVFPMNRGCHLGLVISRSRVRLLVPAPYETPKEAHRKVSLFCLCRKKSRNSFRASPSVVDAERFINGRLPSQTLIEGSTSSTSVN